MLDSDSYAVSWTDVVTSFQRWPTMNHDSPPSHPYVVPLPHSIWAAPETCHDEENALEVMLCNLSVLQLPHPSTLEHSTLNKTRFCEKAQATTEEVHMEKNQAPGQ